MEECSYSGELAVHCGHGNALEEYAMRRRVNDIILLALGLMGLVLWIRRIQLLAAQSIDLVR